ncbi:MAG: bifunctional 3-deoxy-7-phosphoheptulonate synthase/chorismate mutase type II [Flavobacteriales bacterium]|nr:bifunctional 3-deoxy-7-phosphoheptulonate synthase/chorismate mutase type II [Flavobacteriales bacterium]MDP4826520.1 bifunctional 3-deoxy-7-phosphoheptulonate synthase/chorismate mutase type II [Flavobacteriales bacterium]
MEIEIKPLSSWPINTARPLIIAGPCSAETPEQVFHTAEELGKTGKVSLFRAGIWKPRTRPGFFQGIGEPALQWLVEAGRNANLPVTTEVANAAHVEAALKAGVDVLWVGARTTVNPFSVQEIADALKGVDIPVIVKNPINPDLQLWLGAIERFSLSGITRLMAMHRGFSNYGSDAYRNPPMWEIPISLMTMLPKLPVLCDPSHIGGRRDLLFPIAQKAMDLGMLGFMIEVHPNPDQAWSDAQQQITPDVFKTLIEGLEIRSLRLEDPAVTHTLEDLRARIDTIDEQIFRFMKQRLSVIEEIGLYKKEHDLTILQLERWREIVESRVKWATEMSLDIEYIKQYLQLTHSASIRTQSSVMNTGKEDEVIW